MLLWFYKKSKVIHLNDKYKYRSNKSRQICAPIKCKKNNNICDEMYIQKFSKF